MNDLEVDREDAVERLNAIKQFIGYDKDSEIVKATQKSLDMAIKALEQEPCDDTVSLGVFKQVMWERDIAIDQLKELGYGLGQKIEPCDNAISRQAVEEIINDIRDCISVEGYCAILERLKKLPSVNPASNISIQITEREKYGRFN